MEKLSVIVPVYNVEKYLKRCINSILNQEYSYFELILVDDGSTDKSGNICDEYADKDKRIRVIHKENSGLSSARNIGIDVASGSYISFIDSDDYINPNMFKRLMDIANNNNTDIVSCNYIEFEGDKCDSIIVKDKKEYQYNNIEALKNYLLDFNNENKKIHTVVWNKIYKKELFNGIRFPMGKIFEDGYVTYKLLYISKKIFHIEDELYYYFRREGSISKSKFSIKDVYSYDDWREIYRFLYNNCNEISSLASAKYIRKHIEMYIRIKKHKDEIPNFKKYMNEIKSDLKIDRNKLLNQGIDRQTQLELELFLINYGVSIK